MFPLLAHPTLDRSSHTNHYLRKCPTDKLAVLSDGGNYSFKIPPSQRGVDLCQIDKKQTKMKTKQQQKAYQHTKTKRCTFMKGML